MRLAGEFQILLAKRAGNAILACYIAEIVSRGSLILTICGRSHPCDCAIDEPAVVSHHPGAVEERARLAVEATPYFDPALAHSGEEAGD